jgi:ribosome modulation factor
MKRARFEQEAARMKEKYSLPPAQKIALENEEAWRAGYTASAMGRVESRDEAPFADPRLRKQWRAGYDIGRKGLVVPLPPIGAKLQGKNCNLSAKA